MLAVSEKIVMRTVDLASWVVEPQEWNYGSSLLMSPVCIAVKNCRSDFLLSLSICLLCSAM